MEEIIARFEIVRLGVKLADHETVAVQILKLRDLSFDEHLNEIIDLLEKKNYRQALYLMKGYVASLDDSFFADRPVARPTQQKPKPSLEESQNLFDMTAPNIEKTINLDDMLRMTQESIEETVEYEEQKIVTEDYVSQIKEKVQSKKPLFKLEDKKEEQYQEVEQEAEREVKAEATEVTTKTPEPIHEPMTEETVESAKHEPTEELVNTEESADINDIIEDVSVDNTKLESLESETVELENSVDLENEIDADIADGVLEAKETPIATEELEPVESSNHEYVKTREKFQKREEIDKEVNEEKLDDSSIEAEQAKNAYIENEKRYPPISYIDQKFRNMRHQFPQIEESENGIIEEVKVLLKQFATVGYTELDIKNAISEFKKYKQANKKAEAAQILLLAAASESKYAQLLLARELFTGDVLQKDYPESFTQINRLAEHDYPEAICDLAQLYEYGYGIKKDRKTAILLYEEAAEMGIPRAQKHLERLSHQKGIFSSLFK